MWKCNICETINEDNFNFCPICGHGKEIVANTTIILRDNSGNSAPRSSVAPEKHSSQHSSVYPRIVEPARYTESDMRDTKTEDTHVRNWAAALSIAIIIIAILVVPIGHIFMKKSIESESAPADASAELTMTVAVANGNNDDGIWYVGDEPMQISWYASRSDAKYNVELIDSNNTTYIYYENTSTTDLEIFSDYFDENEVHTLRITATDGSEKYIKELNLARMLVTTEYHTLEPITEFAIKPTVNPTDEDLEIAANEEVEVTETTEIADWVVEFEDENLADAIRDTLHISGDILYSDLQELTVLTADDCAIRNLYGIEYCTNLTELSLTENYISDISPLAELEELTDLQLWNNKITDISPLERLYGLTMLGLSNNLISDVSPLAELYGLTWLSLTQNHIADISSLAELDRLTMLYLENNQISDIASLAGLNNLEDLSLDDNLITDVSPLAGMTALEKLEIDIDEIENLDTLSHLDCYIYQY